MTRRVEIIAEAGINHGGSVTSAIALAKIAKDAGADVVKFQTYQINRLLHRSDPDWEKLALCQFSRENWHRIARYCYELGIEFMSTPGDVSSLQFLVEELGVKRIKIGSDDMTYWPLVDAAAATGLPLIISTGMASIEDLIALRNHVDMDKVTLLHCVSLYPCPLDKANLKSMLGLRTFTSKWGYSDHTDMLVGHTAALTAVALGAQVIEKHFCLNIECIDWQVSLYPGDFAVLVQEIRKVEQALGDGVYQRSDEEMSVARRVRKDLSTGLRPLIP